MWNIKYTLGSKDFVWKKECQISHQQFFIFITCGHGPQHLTGSRNARGTQSFWVCRCLPPAASAWRSRCLSSGPEPSSPSTLAKPWGTGRRQPWLQRASPSGSVGREVGRGRSIHLCGLSPAAHRLGFPSDPAEPRRWQGKRGVSAPQVLSGVKQFFALHSVTRTVLK